MPLLDGVVGRTGPQFEDAPAPPPAEERKRGPRPSGEAPAPPDEAAPAEEAPAPLPARTHLGRVVDLVG